ncbi:Putative anti-sigma regulatory factor, serine/threonine protein kinase [Trichlorobacter ammonificans]|uniref:Anti-sigma regulatory factor, serine/threonine protein kinase n=1 Tax=Trichlorobacter ammonificans TaxID=2916410 RepID=A0ABM9D903_9BACT|nr:Putative anti-sigma regulatory factor, serine/threonine protein kinase [Trichlorobacter ammonificans]
MAERVVLLRLETTALVSALPELRARVMAAAGAAGAGDELQQRLELVLEEAVMNTALHGYAGAGGPILVELATREGGELELLLSDQAGSFDPRVVPTPQLSQPLDQRPVGGLGVHLIRTMSDGIRYRRDGERNVLVLTFRARRSDTGC